MKQQPRSFRQRLWFVLRPVLVLTPLIVIAVPMILAAGFTAAVTLGPCGGGEDPGAYSLPYENISFVSSQSKTDIQGYFLPSSSGVTVIVPPTTAAARGSRMHELAVLNRHGLAVLTYDSRNCRGYPNTLGYAEVDDVGDAIHYLQTRSDVDMERIGIQGFSSAGATSILAAARYPLLRSVVAEGNYHDYVAEIRDGINGQLLLLPYELGSRLSYRLITGYDLSVLNPAAAIHEVAPRPIFLIYGSSEPGLPGARVMLADAGPNAQLWVVEGSDHGGYAFVAPQEFERRLTAFYDSAYNLAG